MDNGQYTERLILVSGATGQQGGAVAWSLLKRGFPVRALTRDLEKPEARALAQGGAELVRGDLEDRSSLERALKGVCGVFSVQNFYEGGLKEREGVRSCFAPIRSRRFGVLACDNAPMTSIASFWEML